MTDQPETPQEMLSRLALIASGERECDMSDNDLAALRWLLGSVSVPSTAEQAVERAGAQRHDRSSVLRSGGSR
jgi:hypothetical protein